MKRLLLLLTGGTLLMKHTQDSSRGAITLDEESMSRDLLAEVPGLGRIADFFTRPLFQMDSANMQPADWITLARVVHAELANYDGVVVVHGTDTMAYTASALALLLGPLPKPVVFTGSQRPLVDVWTDARENLVLAATVATLPVPEVSVAMGGRVLRGVRTIKRDAWAFEAFESPNCAPLVELGLDVEVRGHVRAAMPLAPFDDRIDSRVLVVRVFPGLDAELVRTAIRAGVRGLVLEGYGTGNVPLSLIAALEEARDRGIPVIVVSQCPRGFVELGRYEGGAHAEAAGVLSGGDMTVESAVAKAMIGLGRHGAGKAFEDYWWHIGVGERDD